MMAYFEREQRYFILRVYQDLFGDWIVERTNGRKQTHLGKIRKDICQDYSSALQHFFSLADYRVHSRHYRLIHVRRDTP